MLGSPLWTPLPSSLSNRPSPAETGSVCSGLCGPLDPCRTHNPSRDTFILFSLAQKTVLSPHPGTTQPPSPQSHTHSAHKSLWLCLPGVLEIPMAPPLLPYLVGLQGSSLLGQPSAALPASSLTISCSSSQPQGSW